MRAERVATLPLPTTPRGAYCRPENADTLLLGKLNPAHAEPGFGYEDQDAVAPEMSHNTGVDAWPWLAWAELAEALPAFAECSGLLATTCGYYGTTPDHNPFYGYDPAVPNLVRAVGFSGHGAMLGPFTAAAVLGLAEAGHDVDAVLLGDERISVDAFRIGRDLGHPEEMVI
jgi:glycine/D-amino acid oxidase-like deaminating enzyme